MKRIVSVSLGSSARNHSVVISVNGTEYMIERIGTDGDSEKAVRLIKELDGKVDVFGMGGISIYLYGKNHKRYILNSALPIKRAAVKTPIVDGSGLKNTMEKQVVSYLKNLIDGEPKDKKVLMVCGMDRFGMAEAFSREGYDTVYGDIMFSLGLGIPIKSLNTLHALAAALMPVISKLPLKFLYPSGDEQEINTPKFCKYYDEADIVAGDFLYIKKYMPKNMDGKTIVTNTVTPKDIEILRERGVKMLVTSTPELNGRSFGTNVMEALVVAMLGKNPESITPEEYEEVLKQDIFTHRVEYL